MKIFTSYILIGTIVILCSCQNNKSEPSDLKIHGIKSKSETSYSKAIQGAWTATKKNTRGEEITHMAIVTDGYMANASFHKESNKFIKTFGGSWTVKDNVFSLNVEFSSGDSTMVGSNSWIYFKLKEDTFRIDGDNRIWKRVDTSHTDLSGAWLFGGRKKDGEITRREIGARKTMKILSGTRFQWIAYNTDTGKFMGTGGGTYSTKNGEYIEQIEFFSKDNSRVGAKLSFKYNVENNEWHHSGLSSKGDPIYEIWIDRSTIIETDSLK